MNTPPENTPPPNVAADGLPPAAAGPTSPTGATGPGSPTGHGAQPSVAAPSTALRAYPRCAPARRLRRECWPSAWPSAPRSAPHPAPRLRAGRWPRWCCARSPLSRRAARAPTRAPRPSRRPRSHLRRHPRRAPIQTRARPRRHRSRKHPRARACLRPRPEHLQSAHDGQRHQTDSDTPPAGNERVADHARRRHLRAGPRPARGRPLHRLPAPQGRDVPERLVLPGRQRVRERGRAAGGHAAAEPRRDRPAPVPRRRGRRAVQARNRRGIERGRRIPESDRPHDHLESGLQRARPDRDHVRDHRQRDRLQPACRLLDRDARLRTARGRPADLALRPRRRAAEHGV